MSTLIIEIHSTNVDTRKGVTKAGKDWVMHEQKAWIRFKDEPYPQEIKLSLDDEKPLLAGIYSFDPSDCLQVGNYKSLEIDDRVISSRIKFQKELPKQAV